MREYLRRGNFYDGEDGPRKRKLLFISIDQVPNVLTSILMVMFGVFAIIAITSILTEETVIDTFTAQVVSDPHGMYVSVRTDGETYLIKGEGLLTESEIGQKVQIEVVSRHIGNYELSHFYRCVYIYNTT